MYDIQHDLLHWLLLCPLIALSLAFVASSIGQHRWSARLGVLGPLGTFIATLWYASDLQLLVQNKRHVTQYIADWAGVTGTAVKLSFAFDPLAAILLICVSLIIFMTALATADKSETSYSQPVLLNLLLFGLVVLICAEQMLLFLAAWLLTSVIFYYMTANSSEPPSAAGRTFTLCSLAADSLMLISTMILVRVGQGFEFEFMNSNIIANARHIPAEGVKWASITIAVAAGLRAGLLPFGLWRLRATGPLNPAIAVLFAATVVPAIAIICRLTPLFVMGSKLLSWIAMVGAISAMVYALLAMAERRLDRAIIAAALTHVSWIFVALGKGAFSAAVQHTLVAGLAVTFAILVCQRVAKALADAGVERDALTQIEALGGLGSRLPTLFILMGGAMLALTAIIPMSTLASWHQILWQTSTSSMRQGGITLMLLLSWLVLVMALMNAYVRAFYGAWRGRPEVLAKIEPLGLKNCIGLGVGGVLVLLTGWIIANPAILGFGMNADQHLMKTTFRMTKIVSANKIPLFGTWFQATGIMVVLTFAGLLAAVIGWLAYMLNLRDVVGNSPAMRRVGDILNQQFYIVEIFDWLVIKPLFAIGLIIVAVFQSLSSAMLALLGTPIAMLIRRRTKQPTDGEPA